MMHNKSHQRKNVGIQHQGWSEALPSANWSMQARMADVSRSRVSASQKLKMSITLLFCSMFLFFTSGKASADEGMWTFDNPPLEQLKSKYNFTPDKHWLTKVRLASVRIGHGGSGSFVSPNGLVLTNHHVAVGQLQKMSSAKKDYVKDGFFAESHDKEIKCPDLEINVLDSMENVTQKMLAAVKKNMTPAQAVKARTAEQANLEKESKAKTGLLSQVVSLYHGGEYWLYRYRQYKDVRLVMAPEKQIAFFGGDQDNFTYPRYDLDMAFFRVYHKNKPLKTPHYLKINPKSGKRGELVFITGHPGRTQRLRTMAELKRERDDLLPMKLDILKRYHATLKEYSKEGKENARRAKTKIFGLANAIKAITGMLQGLRDPLLMEKKQNEENAFRKRVNANPAWRKEYASAWRKIERTLQRHHKQLNRQAFQQMHTSQLARIAINIVKYAQEITKPDADRLDGFHDAELDELKFYLLSPAPIYPDMEAALLETNFQISKDNLGDKDPWVKIIAANGGPKTLAQKLTQGTKLIDVVARKKLLDGGLQAVMQSEDPFIMLAKEWVPILRKNEEWRKRVVDAELIPAQEKIGKARFAIFGKSVYPDATFTLRMTYGRVKGYPMNGTFAPSKTTLYGLYDRALSFDGRRSWWIPYRFWKHKNDLNLSTPVNFVSNCDIIGGNSGSPVINRKAELVGVVFDGNIESLPGAYIFDGRANRAVALHAAFISEALTKLYGAKKLLAEMQGK